MPGLSLGVLHASQVREPIKSTTRYYSKTSINELVSSRSIVPSPPPTSRLRRPERRDFWISTEQRRPPAAALERFKPKLDCSATGRRNVNRPEPRHPTVCLWLCPMHAGRGAACSAAEETGHRREHGTFSGVATARGAWLLFLSVSSCLARGVIKV